MMYFKLSNGDSGVYQPYTYVEGLNVDCNPWQDNSPECSAGGLYFCSLAQLASWIGDATHIWDVEIPANTQIRHFSDKSKAHSIIMRNKRPLCEIWRGCADPLQPFRNLQLSKQCGVQLDWAGLSQDEQCQVMREYPMIARYYDVPHQLRVESAPEFEDCMQVTKKESGYHIWYTKMFTIPYTTIVVEPGTSIICADFAHGMAQGAGSVHLPNGVIIAGQFCDGLMHGPAVQRCDYQSIWDIVGIWRWGIPTDIRYV